LPASLVILLPVAGLIAPVSRSTMVAFIRAENCWEVLIPSAAIARLFGTGFLALDPLLGYWHRAQ
jgi:hypothetical protein